MIVDSPADGQRSTLRGKMINQDFAEYGVDSYFIMVGIGGRIGRSLWRPIRNSVRDAE